MTYQLFFACVCVVLVLHLWLSYASVYGCHSSVCRICPVGVCVAILACVLLALVSVLCVQILFASVWRVCVTNIIIASVCRICPVGVCVTNLLSILVCLIICISFGTLSGDFICVCVQMLWIWLCAEVLSRSVWPIYDLRLRDESV